MVDENLSYSVKKQAGLCAVEVRQVSDVRTELAKNLYDGTWRLPAGKLAKQLTNAACYQPVRCVRGLGSRLWRLPTRARSGFLACGSTCS